MAHNKIVQYIVDSWSELGKVTWPTKNKALNICVIVLLFVFACAALFAGVDYVFNFGYTELIDFAAEHKLN